MYTPTIRSGDQLQAAMQASSVAKDDAVLEHYSTYLKLQLHMHSAASSLEAEPATAWLEDLGVMLAFVNADILPKLLQVAHACPSLYSHIMFHTHSIHAEHMKTRSTAPHSTAHSSSDQTWLRRRLGLREESSAKGQ